MNSMAQKNTDDELSSLLAKARQGDSEAFCDLCRYYETPLRRRAMALCGNATMADELAQETLFSAWKSLARFDGKCQFLTWLCAILIHHHRSRLRSPWVRLARPNDSEKDLAWEEIADEAERPDRAVELSEQATLMRQSLDRLSPKHREVVFLRFYNNESLAGIAAGLNCSIGTVKSRLFHALESLRGLKSLAENRKMPKL